MSRLAPKPRPQLLGTQLKLQNEGTPRQMAKLSPVRFLIPPAPEIERYDPVKGGTAPSGGSNVARSPHLDYYGQTVEDDVETEDEDEVDVPLIEPAPRRNQFAEESICACSRFSLLKKSQLAILDDYAKHVASQHWTVPYEPIMKVKKIQIFFEHQYNHRGHRQTWFYRQVTKQNSDDNGTSSTDDNDASSSRRSGTPSRMEKVRKLLGCVFLSIIREEKNIVDNERFTKDVLNVQRKGPSDLQLTAKKNARRSSESRRSTSTRDTRSRHSTSEKATSLWSSQSVRQEASPSTEAEKRTPKEPGLDGSNVEISVDFVDGRPSLHRNRRDVNNLHEGPAGSDGKRRERERDSVQEEADRHYREMIRARKEAQEAVHAPSIVVTPPPTIVITEAPPPPAIILFEPDSDNPSRLVDEAPVKTGRSHSVSCPEITITAPPEITVTAPTESEPVVLFAPTQEHIPEGKNESMHRQGDNDSSTLPGDNSITRSDTQTTLCNSETEGKIPLPSLKHPPIEKHTSVPPLNQNERGIEATPKSSTITSASTRRPKPAIDPSSEGPSTKNIWIVIGWFPAEEESEPIETCVIVEDPGQFLPQLKRHITGLRGWRSILSFKSVQSFGLYQCRPQQLGHVSHHTTELENLTLSQFFQACNQTYKCYDYYQETKDSEDWNADVAFIRCRDSMAWAQWVHKNLNASRSYPFRSQLSLKLVLRWSTTRISIASAIPLVMAFVVGFWYSSVHDDPQTAWTIGSFIVTAGAFIIAILAALTSLKDGQATPYPKVRISDSAV